MIWSPEPGGRYSHHLWAPEIHFLHGKWYIYYTANDGRGDDSRRICVLENESPNPMDGEWIWKGALDIPVPGLDGTVLKMVLTLFSVRRLKAWLRCIEMDGFLWIFSASTSWLENYAHGTGLRATRIQKFEWNRDGTPDFGVPFSDDHALQVPSGE